MTISCSLFVYLEPKQKKNENRRKFEQREIKQTIEEILSFLCVILYDWWLDLTVSSSIYMSLVLDIIQTRSTSQTLFVLNEFE